MKTMKVKYLGQNGFVMEWEDKKICFDLYLSNCVYELTGGGIRNYAAPCEIEDLKGIEYYFISHEHLDHLDPPTVSKMAEVSPETKFVCPVPCVPALKKLGISEERIIGASANKLINLDGVQVYPIPEKHEEYSLVDGEYENLGYVVQYEGFKLFHAGDAVADQTLADELKAQGKFNAMFVPINGHDWKRFNADIMGNMNYREALDLCAYAGTDLVVPMHYDLFNNNTENPAYFVDYLYKTYPTQKFKMFMPGEEMVIVY